MKHRMIGRVSLAAVLLAGLPWSAYAKVLKLDTPSTSMVLDAEKGKNLKFLYYGGRISDSDADQSQGSRKPRGRRISRLWA